MKLGRMHAENFMSIINTSADFSNKGLVLILGKNEDSEAFESNGSGKSTVFTETVVWALYGETIRGQKGDSVVNKKVKKNTMVSLEIIDDNGDVYTIERYRKHSQQKNHVLLFKNGENITGKSDTDTDIKIIELLQMDFSTFTNSIMFGQGMTKMFASSTDSEQKKILERMLQIDIYKTCQDKAKQYLKQTDDSIFSLEATIDSTYDKKMSLSAHLTSLQEKEAQLGKQVQDRIEVLTGELGEARESLDKLPKIDDLRDKENGLLKEYNFVTDKINKDYKKYEQQLADLKAEKRTIEQAIRKVNGEIDTKEKELKDIRSGKNIPKTCRTCGQSLPLKDTSHLENHLEEAIRELAKSVDDYTEIDIPDIDNLIHKVEKRLKGKEKLEEQQQELHREIVAFDKEVTVTLQQEKNLLDLQARIRRQIAEQEKLLSVTYTGLIEKTISDIVEVEHQLTAHKEQLDKLKVTREHYNFWTNSFGNQGIKSVLLDSVTPFLNERANYYLNKLADSSIEVKFSTQQELKSGEKRDKFSVEVYNANGDDEYKGNSGGEKRRIDVSVNMALQDLVLSRSNKRLDLIVYDECFESLDEVGCEAVIELLHEKATEVGSVLVITHNDTLKQMFTKSLTVHKENSKTIVLEESI